LRKAKDAVRSLRSVDTDAIVGLDIDSQRILLEKALESIRRTGSSELIAAADQLLEKLQNDSK
jgi:hypothetical protein